MEKNRRNLLITLVILVVVMVGAIVIYNVVVSRSKGPSASYTPQLALPSDVSIPTAQSNTAAQSSVATVSSGPVATEPMAESEPQAVVDTEVPADHAASVEEATETASMEQPASAPVVPDLPLNTLDGVVTSFDTVRDGRPVVLAFWATWCPSCKMEIGVLQKAYEELGDQVSFMLLATPDGQRETVDTIKDYVAKNGITAPVYWDNGLFAYVFGANMIPTTAYINADGTLATGYIGYVPEEAMVQEIRNLL